VIKKINAMGFIHFIEKPFEFDDLTDKISYLLPARAKSSNSLSDTLNNSESRVQTI
jgi:hypothetical protein